MWKLIIFERHKKHLDFISCMIYFIVHLFYNFITFFELVMGSGSKSRVRVGFGYHFSGSGRVPKKSGFPPGFRVFQVFPPGFIGFNAVG